MKNYTMILIERLQKYQLSHQAKLISMNILLVKKYYPLINSKIFASKNSRTSDPHRQLLNLTTKIDLRRKDRYIALSNLSIYYTWKNIKKSYKNNKFKISAPIWNEEFELPDESYSISDIQDYFEYILKKHGEITVNTSIKICTNKIENIITLKTKTGYYL